MMVLVTYDVCTEGAAGAKRLRRVAKTCENYGQRVQNSVFECLVEPFQLVEMKNKLLQLIDTESDSLRIYYLGKNWRRRVDHFGVLPLYEQEGTIIL